MADTAVDEDRKTAFYSLGDFRQDVGRSDHTVEDAAAVVADDDAFGTGIGTGNGFFRRHDAFYDKGQGRRFDQLGNVTGALRADGLAKDMHIDQRRRIDIAGNGKGMGLFSDFNFFNDLVVAARFDRRNDRFFPFFEATIPDSNMYSMPPSPVKHRVPASKAPLETDSL